MPLGWFCTTPPYPARPHLLLTRRSLAGTARGGRSRSCGGWTAWCDPTTCWPSWAHPGASSGLRHCQLLAVCLAVACCDAVVGCVAMKVMLTHLPPTPLSCCCSCGKTTLLGERLAAVFCFCCPSGNGTPTIGCPTRPPTYPSRPPPPADTLAGRLPRSAKPTGDIRVNGHRCELTLSCGLPAYVTQDEVVGGEERDEGRGGWIHGCCSAQTCPSSTDHGIARGRLCLECRCSSVHSRWPSRYGLQHSCACRRCAVTVTVIVTLRSAVTCPAAALPACSCLLAKQAVQPVPTAAGGVPVTPTHEPTAAGGARLPTRPPPAGDVSC